MTAVYPAAVCGGHSLRPEASPGGTGPQPTKEEPTMKGKIDTRNAKIIGRKDDCPMMCGLPLKIAGRAARLEMDDRGWYAIDKDGWRLYHIDGQDVEVLY